MPQFDRLTVYNTMLADGMIPLFYNGDPETAKHMTSAIVRGGGRVLEFTNRGAQALEVFRALVQHGQQQHTDLIIGVGSIEDAPTAALFLAHGANFIVGPTFQEDIARLCNRRKVAYIPGCGSVNEIATAEEWGVEIVKAFPGGSIGGPGFIEAVLGPRPWSRIMPTGGVSESNLADWFKAGAACVGMGSQLFRKEWIQSGNFDAMSENVQRTLATIRGLRGH